MSKAPKKTTIEGGDIPAARVEQAVAIFTECSVYEVENFLRRMAEKSGNDAFDHAARALFVPAGRPLKNDDAALAKIEIRLRDGLSSSVEAAARFVAVTLGGHSVEATMRRLARKYRSSHKS